MSVAMVVMLSGGPRPSELAAAAGRPALDLLLREGATLADLWVQRFDALAFALNKTLPVKIVHSGQTPVRPAKTGGRVDLSIQQEKGELRGPGGLARDETEGLSEDDSALLIEAARLPACDLSALARAHEERGADVTVAVNPDMSPSGVYAIRRSAVSGIQERGFLDLKEQLIGKLVREGRGVWSYQTPAPGCFPIRSLAQLIRAARELAGPNLNMLRTESPISGLGGGLRYDPTGLKEETGAASSPPREGAALGSAVFSVVAEGAAVAGSAALVDSVVMSGCEVGEGAVVVRSLLCPGARVHPGAEVVDAVVTASP